MEDSTKGRVVVELAKQAPALVVLVVLVIVFLRFVSEGMAQFQTLNDRTTGVIERTTEALGIQSRILDENAEVGRQLAEELRALRRER